MIKSYSIVLEEVDDHELALEELKAQLSGIELLKSSVGIVSVNKDFIFSGVYCAVAKAVPFPLAGSTSFSQTVNGKIGTYLLSIMVLTSDDCEFACGLSDVVPEIDDVTEVTKKCYNNLQGTLGSEVKLTLLYPPFMFNHYPNQYIRAISEIDERVPVFGTLPNGEVIDVTTDARVLYGEHIYGDKIAMILVSGNVSPSFYIGSATKESIVLPNVGVITSAEGNCLREINGTSTVKFFEKMKFGLENVKETNILSKTFLMDEKDENGEIISSVTKSLIGIEGGSYFFGCGLQIGSNVSIVAFTGDVVMASAKDVVKRIKENHSGGIILIYSCIGRLVALTSEPMKEFKFLNENLESFSYVATCSGGEICPTSVTKAKAINNEHNETLIACVL